VKPFSSLFDNPVERDILQEIRDFPAIHGEPMPAELRDLLLHPEADLCELPFSSYYAEPLTRRPDLVVHLMHECRVDQILQTAMVYQIVRLLALWDARGLVGRTERAQIASFAGAPDLGEEERKKSVAEAISWLRQDTGDLTREHRLALYIEGDVPASLRRTEGFTDRYYFLDGWFVGTGIEMAANLVGLWKSLLLFGAERGLEPADPRHPYEQIFP
jgi:hypothetical protein